MSPPPQFEHHLALNDWAQWSTRCIKTLMALVLCGHVGGSSFYASDPTDSDVASRVFSLRHSTTPAYGLRWPASTGKTTNGQLFPAKSSLFLSTHISIATSAKYHLCRFSPHESWIRSLARPLVLCLWCCQPSTTETCPVPLVSYHGDFTVPDSAGRPEKCGWGSVFHTANAGGRFTTAALREGGGGHSRGWCGSKPRHGTCATSWGTPRAASRGMRPITFQRRPKFDGVINRDRERKKL